jgi:hypothetical protein
MTKLEDIKKVNCFRTPDGYFEKLESDVLKNIALTKNRQYAKTRFEIIRPYIYLAAGMILLVAVMRLGLEFGLGDVKPTKPDVEIANESTYFNELYEHIVSDENFVISYILDEDDYVEDSEIDIEYLEDYLAYHINELDYYID